MEWRQSVGDNVRAEPGVVMSDVSDGEEIALDRLYKNAVPGNGHRHPETLSPAGQNLCRTSFHVQPRL
jgi:hypothetical protein